MIRRATAADAGVVASLLFAFNTEFDCPTPDVDVLADRLKRLLTSENFIVLLAGEGSPVALALVTLRPSVWYEGDVGLLDELFVVPEHRNKGIGSALFQAAELHLKEVTAGELQINVDGGDVDAQRFYERHGYVDRDE